MSRPSGTPRGRATRDQLQAAALDTLRVEGIAGLSARVIAERAGVNQALIFYHFGSLAGLVDAACRGSATRSVAQHRARLAAADTFAHLLAAGRDLHDYERATGNVAVMAQLLAGAQQDAELAATARFCLNCWQAEVETAVRRLLTGSPLELVIEPAALARTISAGFLGLELYEGVDPNGARLVLESLQRLGALVEAVDDLGPVARRAVRARLRKAGLASAATRSRSRRRKDPR